MASNRNETEQLAQELREILTRSIEGNLQLLTHMSGMVRDAAESFTSGAGAARQTPQPDVVANRLIRLNLSYLSLLSKHGLAFANELLTVTGRTLDLKSAGSPSNGSQDTASSDGPPVQIVVNAPVGETASAAFLIENTQGQPVEMGFEAGEVLSRQGRPVPNTAVRFDPESLHLKPRMQATVKAMIDITPDFVVGEQYFVRVRLVGFEKKEVWIGLNIMPGQEIKAPTASRAAKSATDKKKAAKRVTKKKGRKKST